jgi:hypothetical protein
MPDQVAGPVRFLSWRVWPSNLATELACDALVRLPNSIAVERAILAGATTTQIRAAASVFPSFGQPDPTVGTVAADVSDAVMKLLHKKGLHEQFLSALVDETGVLPAVMQDALSGVVLCSSPTYAGPNRIDLADPTAVP